MSATRKEKSRNAARNRRRDENVQYETLTELLPYPTKLTSNLDKVSIIRLAVCLLKYKELTGRVLKYEDISNNQFLKALNGLVLVLDEDRKVLYVSPTVFEHLQISQVDMIGNDIFHFIHPDDHKKFKEILDQYLIPMEQLESTSDVSCNRDSSRIKKKINMFAVSLKIRCFVNSKNRNKNRYISYKVAHISGYFLPSKDSSIDNIKFAGLAAIVEIIPNVSLFEYQFGSDAYIVRCDMDAKILFCEGRIRKFFEFTAKDFVGLTGYNWVHPNDLSIVKDSHLALLKTGKSCTHIYRFLNKYGGWVHLLTRSIAIKKDGKDEILSINCIHSGIEFKDVILTDSQKYWKRLDLKKKSSDTELSSSSISKRHGTEKTVISDNNVECCVAFIDNEVDLSKDIENFESLQPQRLQHGGANHVQHSEDTIDNLALDSIDQLLVTNQSFSPPIDHSAKFRSDKIELFPHIKDTDHPSKKLPTTPKDDLNNCFDTAFLDEIYGKYFSSSVSMQNDSQLTVNELIGLIESDDDSSPEISESLSTLVQSTSRDTTTNINSKFY